jgi:sugar phosphate isomerase/epimerase
MLSVATDYVKESGCPEPYLKRIAEAGFSHVHWAHHWRTDFVYSDHEIEQIAKWLRDFGLELNDLHASAGVEKAWVSPLEYERLAGVELVQNRIDMTARLSSDVIVMHIRREPEDREENSLFWTQVQRSLDAIEPYARARGVRIAIENLYPDSFGTIEKILSRYGSDYVGLCYDSGHGNLDICSDGLDHLEKLNDRLISMHLSDNDGTDDQHNLLFSGKVDWERLAGMIAESSYSKCVNMEITLLHSGIEDVGAFLEKAFQTGMVFSRMVDELRRGRLPAT